MLDYGCFLNLPNEEWACKVMVNIITNTGFENDETKKERYV